MGLYSDKPEEIRITLTEEQRPRMARLFSMIADTLKYGDADTDAVSEDGDY